MLSASRPQESVARLAYEEGLVPPLTPRETPASADILPASCRELLVLLKKESPETANRVVELLSERSSRLPGVLKSLADSPPPWLQEAGFLPLEILGIFLEAHRLPGSWVMRQNAIGLGSPRGGSTQNQRSDSRGHQRKRHPRSGTTGRGRRGSSPVGRCPGENRRQTKSRGC